MKARLILIGLMATLLITGCGLTGYERWAAYSVDLVVLNKERNLPVSGARISTESEQEVSTNRQGKANVRFMVGGVKVITVSAPGWQTEQVKVAVPQNYDGPIVIELTAMSEATQQLEDMAGETR